MHPPEGSGFHSRIIPAAVNVSVPSAEVIERTIRRWSGRTEALIKGEGRPGVPAARFSFTSSPRAWTAVSGLRFSHPVRITSASAPSPEIGKPIPQRCKLSYACCSLPCAPVP